MLSQGLVTCGFPQNSGSNFVKDYINQICVNDSKLNCLKKGRFIRQRTVFTRISAAALIKFFAPQVRRLFEGGAYLKIGRDKEIFSYNLTV